MPYAKLYVLKKRWRYILWSGTGVRHSVRQCSRTTGRMSGFYSQEWRL